MKLLYVTCATHRRVMRSIMKLLLHDVMVHLLLQLMLYLIWVVMR